MKTLLKIFLPQIIYQSLLYSLAATLILLLITVVIHDSFALFYLDHLQVLVAIIVGSVSSLTLFSKHLNWINVIPLSKTKIYLTRYILGMLILVLYATFGTLSSVFVFILTMDSDLTSKAVAYSQEVNRILQLPLPVIEFLCVSLLIATSNSLCVVKSFNSREYFLARWFHPNSTTRFFNRAQTVGIALLSTYFFFNISIITYILYILVSIFLLLEQGSFSLNLTFQQRSHLRTGWVVAAISIFFTSYGFLNYQIRYGNSRSQVEAIRDLSPFNDGFSIDKWNSIFDADLTDRDFYTLSKEYKAKFNERKKIDIRNSSHLSLISLLKYQNNVRNLNRVFDLFDIKSLNSDDLIQVFTRYEESFTTPMIWEQYSILFPVQLSPEKLIEILNVNQSGAGFALIKMRYDRRPDYIPAILKTIGGYQNELLSTAIKTLSILYGEPLPMTLQGWTHLKDKKFFEANCAQFHPPDVESITDAQIPALNACIRSHDISQDRCAIANIEQFTWLSRPFSPPQQELIRKIFKMISR